LKNTKVKLIKSKLNVPSIDLITELGEIDLHNYADFKGFQYGTDGNLKLYWKENICGEFKIGSIAIKSFTIVFQELFDLSFLSPDGTTQRKENETLEHFIIEVFEVELYKLKFVFNSENVIHLSAKKVECIIE
jgi:hypothetical protein